MTTLLVVALVVLTIGLLATIRVARARMERARSEAWRTARAAEERLEENLRQTITREQILAGMDEGVILSERGTVVYANAAAHRLFGADEIRSLPPSVRVPREDSTIQHDITLHHPSMRELRLTVSAMGTDRVLVVARDVTEANRIDAIRRDFVANASHELKTPVAAIQAAAETLEYALVDDIEAARRFAASLGEESRRLSSLVQDLLDLARLEQEAGTAEILRLDDIIRPVIADCRDRCAATGLHLEQAIDTSAAVRGRREDLSLLVRNLLDNAVRYTQRGGTIRIEADEDGAFARIRVSDTGVGIPQHDLPRIFERFFRVDQARARDTGGTGLGLSIVRHVAERHGGAVTAESELGKGSTFTVTLPRV